MDFNFTLNYAVERTKATHIIVLMNPNQFGHREFGFGVEEPGPGQEVCCLDSR